MKEDRVFESIKWQIADAIDKILGDENGDWQNDPVSYLPDNISERMADAAMTAIRAVSDHEKWLTEQGFVKFD